MSRKRFHLKESLTIGNFEPKYQIIRDSMQIVIVPSTLIYFTPQHKSYIKLTQKHCANNGPAARQKFAKRYKTTHVLKAKHNKSNETSNKIATMAPFMG